MIDTYVYFVSYVSYPCGIIKFSNCTSVVNYKIDDVQFETFANNIKKDFNLNNFAILSITLLDSYNKEEREGKE